MANIHLANLGFDNGDEAAGTPNMLHAGPTVFRDTLPPLFFLSDSILQLPAAIDPGLVIANYIAPMNWLRAISLLLEMGLPEADMISGLINSVRRTVLFYPGACMHFHSNIDITHNRYPTTWADVAQARIAFMVWRAPPGRYSGSSRDAAASALHRVTGMDLVEIRAIPRADAADWLACHNDSDY